jgi:DNA-binding transcriptional regulator YbjK
MQVVLQPVAAAMRVVQREGVCSLTTRTVAQETVVPLGAVHDVSGSRAELVRAVSRADRDRSTALLRRSAGPGPQEADERVASADLPSVRGSHPSGR